MSTSQQRKATSSSPFFRTTKVDSCQFVKTYNGVPFAVAYPQKKTGYKAPNSWVNQRRSSETASHNAKTYKPVPAMHAGMRTKPLVPYDPFSYRSRLPTADFIIPYQNSSQVEIGDRSAPLKNHFKTTTGSYMAAPDLQDYTSNQGIVARRTLWHKNHTAN